MDDSTVYFKKQQKNRIQFITKNDDAKRIIKDTYTIANPAARFHSNIPSTLSAISQLNAFNCGLFLDIIKLLKTKLDCKIVIDKNIFPMIHPFKWNESELIEPINDSYKYRDYQKDAIYKCMKYGRGNVNLSTAGGKSLIIYGIILNIIKQINPKFRFLICVPTPQLVLEFYDKIIEYGCGNLLRPAKFSSINREFDSHANIIISNSSWLIKHKDEFKFNPNVLIIDEVHTIKKNNKICRVINTFPSMIRFGFSGTLANSNDEENLWNVIGLVGPELISIYPHELQKDNYISLIKIKAIKLIHYINQPQPPPDITDRLERAKKVYPLEFKYIENNKHINNFLVDFIYNLNGNSVVLFDHTKHLNSIYDLCLSNKKEVFKINGSVPLQNRPDICNRIEKINNGVIIANHKCFGTGIDVSNIHNIVFASGYSKAAVKTIQGIGRGLRLNNNKNKLNLYDIYHSFRYSSRHFMTRLNLYKEFYNMNISDIIYKTVEVKKLEKHYA